MDRRNFIGMLGLGSVATAAPVAVAYAVQSKKDETKLPPKEEFPHFRLYNEERNISLNVGEDGRLWVKNWEPGSQWKRIALED